ncbi:hypothetical protein D3C73_809680 [compost metagenome]
MKVNKEEHSSGAGMTRLGKIEGPLAELFIDTSELALITLQMEQEHRAIEDEDEASGSYYLGKCGLIWSYIL